METSSEQSIDVKAFLHRKWAENPLEVRRFTVSAENPLTFDHFSSKVAAAFSQHKQDELKIHWKGEHEHSCMHMSTR